ncbi:cysteine peptidase family C39 domain-containing protein [Actinocorallia sp. A-T 12471]|uniref:cysteine peptidase family C39 domain-containing protein n=1 Tax=Actinocorallia sp. A-T 12471 TaxID=3089813 RepID=UPI0029D394CE|nr:cysteine peptidase family C39 domain-containing protein [Actinocorallia sp. A-T 12471]MDX6739198.1 cysteine peptidase family C39 domain-containing protein [Actinocorallia sp. A-T 12471]
MSQVHDVPMCRQLIDPEEWDRCGGWALGDRVKWSDRACGMASLRMILLAYGHQDVPPLTELVKLGVKREAYIAGRGWLHAGLAHIATEFGVPATAEPVDAADLVHRLDDAPLIISVTERFPQDGRSGGHLVVARGHQDGHLLIRDPSSWGQTHDRVPATRATASYTGRAITFAPMPRRTS